VSVVVRRPAWWFARSGASTGTSGARPVLVSWSGATAPRPAWGHLTVECAEPGCRSKCFSPRHEPGVNGPGTGARPAAVPGLRAAV